MKIKRYTLGRVTLAKTENSSLQGAGIVECENGEFVRHDEVESLLESIGAGGVSGRITSKTIDEHRADFERFASSHGLSVNQDTSTGSGLFNSHVVSWMWKAWIAARGINEP